MFFFLELAMSLKGAKPGELVGRDSMDWIKFFFLAMSFTMGYSLVSLGVSYATEVGASAGVLAAANTAFTIYVVTAVVGVFSLLIYFVFQIPKFILEATGLRKKKEEDDEE